MHAPQTQTPEWKRLLELHKPYLALSLELTEVEGKRYVMVFADDFSDWKEFAIYTTNANNKKVEEVVEKIEEIVEKAENEESYDLETEIANLVSRIIGEFIIGEIPEELGDCGDEDYIAFPEEDERLNWPLCYGGSFARSDLQLLMRHNLLPEEWIPHVQKKVFKEEPR